MMGRTTQEQAVAWSTYQVKELPTIAEQEAYNQIRGLLQLHPSELTAADYRTIRELSAFLEKSARERTDVTVVSERENTGGNLTEVEYRGRTFTVAVNTIPGTPDEPVSYSADVTEVVNEQITAEWDGSGLTYDTSEEAYEAAVSEITITVDDDLDGTR